MGGWVGGGGKGIDEYTHTYQAHVIKRIAEFGVELHGLGAFLFGFCVLPVVGEEEGEVGVGVGGGVVGEGGAVQVLDLVSTGGVGGWVRKGERVKGWIYLPMHTIKRIATADRVTLLSAKEIKRQRKTYTQGRTRTCPRFSLPPSLPRPAGARLPRAVGGQGGGTRLASVLYCTCLGR